MIDELKALREWGGLLAPAPAQKNHARALLQVAISERVVSPSSGRFSRLRRPIVLAAAGIIVGAATAVAAIYQFSPEPALELEGRRMVEESLEKVRSIVIGDLTWTAYTYETDHGLVCVDLDLTDKVAAESLGSIGSCTGSDGSSGLQGVVGGVSVSGAYRQVLAGVAPEGTASIRAVADDGTVLSDVPENGVWILVPGEPQSQWVIESLHDGGGEVLVLVDSDASSDGTNEGRAIEPNVNP